MPEIRSEINETLLAVRKAYRLLYAYQDSIKSTVFHIADRLGLEPRGGDQIFSLAPSRSNNLRDRWAWDWLGFYCFSFDFLLPNTSSSGNGGHQYLSVIVQSDNGYYKQEDFPDNKILPSEWNQPVEDSESRLIFIRGGKPGQPWERLIDPEKVDADVYVVSIEDAMDAESVDKLIEDLRSQFNLS